MPTSVLNSIQPWTKLYSYFNVHFAGSLNLSHFFYVSHVLIHIYLSLLILWTQFKILSYPPLKYCLILKQLNYSLIANPLGSNLRGVEEYMLLNSCI